MKANVKASMKYNREKTTQVPVILNNGTDADIIEYLNVLKLRKQSKLGFIKNAIRQAIAPIEYAEFDATEAAYEKIFTERITGEQIRQAAQVMRVGADWVETGNGMMISYIRGWNRIMLKMPQESAPEFTRSTWTTSGGWEYVEKEEE